MKPPMIPVAVTSIGLVCTAGSHPRIAIATGLTPPAAGCATVGHGIGIGQAPPVVRAGLLQSTLIVLPAEEKVANRLRLEIQSIGFSTAAMSPAASSASSQSSRMAHQRTFTSFPITAMSTRWSFSEISSEVPTLTIDSKILHRAGRRSGQRDRLTDSFPCSCRPQSWTRRSRTPPPPQAAQAADSESGTEVKRKPIRSQYPGSLHFDYTWDETEGQRTWAAADMAR